ncbi:MAG: DUF2029 domain-containing protein [Chloroflexi bacterium]|nr:DUF2029 domain-containing protein [Chloroflexota bacterium]
MATPTRLLLAGFAVLHILLFTIGFHGPLYPQEGPGDIPLYFSWASPIFAGQYPYLDVAIPYPPLSLLAFLPPRLFTASPTTYWHYFVLEMAVLDVLVLALLVAATNLLRRSAPQVLAYYTLAVLALGPVAAQRFDLLPATLVLLSLVLFAKGSHRLAWAVLAAATLAKLYPLVVAPLFLLVHLRGRKPRAAIEGVAVFAATALVLIAPFLLRSPGGLWHSLSFQLGRGVHAESTYASALMAGSLLGVGNITVPSIQFPSYGGYRDIATSMAPQVAALSTVLGVAVLGAVYLLFLREPLQKRQARTEAPPTAPPTPAAPASVVSYALLAILAFIVTSRILSPQFLVWLAPLVALIPGRRGLALLAMFMAGGALTQYVYPSHYGELAALAPKAVLALLVRNALLVAMAGLLVDWRAVWATGHDRLRLPRRSQRQSVADTRKHSDYNDAH